MARRILLLGPPGAGKGTQATLIASALHVPHISTGAMLRAAVAAGTRLGKQAESVMASGELVSDELVVAIVDERLSQDDARCGYLLDGFPRNVAQAEALNDSVVDAIGTVVLLNVDTEEVIVRMMRRAEEEGRSDDNEEAIRRRLEVYSGETTPLVTFYDSAVLEVDGMGSVEAIFSRIMIALAKS
ncbi:MAG: adenylate kinase [Actinobacteria bacterium]|nr:MAG: adenylate kinase [Actinomycetota bacterium]